MHKYILLAVLIILSSFKDSSKNESKVTQVARENLSKFLTRIPVGNEAQFGFTTRDEFNTSSVGRPYHVLVLSKEFYSAQTLTNDNYIIESNEWRVPVMVDRSGRALLTVTGQDGNYEATNIGGAGLAKELQQASGNLKNDDTYYILRIHRLHADFLVDVHGDNLNGARFIPLTSARMGIPSLNTNGYSMTEILNAIKKALINHPEN